MVNDFRIEKGRLPVDITLVDGEAIAGELFIQASARHRFAMEDAAEIMNAPDRFFPLRLRTDNTLLVAKDRVRDVQVTYEHATEADWSIGTLTPVTITLEGGAIYTGKFLVEPPLGRTRVLDFLNRTPDRFLTLYQDDGIVLVNRSEILHVRQLIDATT